MNKQTSYFLAKAYDLDKTGLLFSGENLILLRSRFRTNRAMATETLGPFQIGRVLGRGGMGAVYEGTYEEDGSVVAIKVLSDALDDEEDAEIRLRFETEIETLKRLHHPNIVQLSGFGEDQGKLYYVMEFINGSSLQQELRKKRSFQWFEVAKIGLEICQALRHAHDRGVIHRDIKPANILLDQEGNVKLSDFGIARFFGSQQITDIHSVVGTLEYMSPEQALAHPIGTGSDLYSLGCVLYALLTGKPPFTARSLPEILHKHKSTIPTPIHSARSDVPEDLIYLVNDLVQIQPEDRPRNAPLVTKRLQALLQALAGAPETLKVFPTSLDTAKQPSESALAISGCDIRLNVPLPQTKQENGIREVVPLDEGAAEEVPQSETLAESFKRIGEEHLPHDQGVENHIDFLAETKASSKSEGRQLFDHSLQGVAAAAAPASASGENPATALRRDAGKSSARFVSIKPKNFDPFEEDHQTTRPIFSLPVALTSTMLMVVGLIVYYLIQPATPEVLFKRITAKIKKDESSDEPSLTLLRSVQKDIEQFLSWHPTHPMAGQVQAYQDKLELLEHERRLERRAQFSGVGSLSPVEQAYIEVLTSSPNNSEQMVDKLRAFIAVFQSTESPPGASARSHRLASNPVEICVELARRQLKKLEQTVEETNTEQIQVIRRRLEEAENLDSENPVRAEAIRRGIIELYQHHRWAKELVDEATQQLNQHGQ